MITRPADLCLQELPSCDLSPSARSIQATLERASCRGELNQSSCSRACGVPVCVGTASVLFPAAASIFGPKCRKTGLLLWGMFPCFSQGQNHHEAAQDKAGLAPISQMLVVKMLTHAVLCMDGAGKRGVSLFIMITTCISRVSLTCLGREIPRVSVLESSAAHAQGPFHRVSGHLLSTLSYSSSPAAGGFNIPDKWLTSFFTLG